MSKTNQVFEPLTVLQALAARLPGPNMDTDQIIPARFLKKERAQGYGQYLFFDARFDETEQALLDHPLNASPAPKVLVVEDNFGCGSSREGAVYALADFGVRVVIGTTFGDIFYNNCFKNGLLPIRLLQSDHQALFGHLSQARVITVDLLNQHIDWGSGQAQFEIDAFWKECLTQGLDELSLTLSHQADIERFERQYQRHYPWLTPTS
jgi:3-isopropylmalate/(R)-2-methylmalate dehydratase small subunit